MFKCALFDIDGTILDSMGNWDWIFNTVIKMYNINDLTEEEIELYKSISVMSSPPIIKKNHNLKESAEEILNEVVKLAKIEYEYNIEAKPFCIDYLEKLYNEGIKIGIVTSGLPELFELSFKRLGIDKYISAVAYSDEVGVDKSNPDVYLLAAERLNVNFSDCMVYEDIKKGIIGAKKANMQTTAVFDKWNEYEKEELKALADIYIDSWEELL